MYINKIKVTGSLLLVGAVLASGCRSGVEMPGENGAAPAAAKADEVRVSATGTDSAEPAVAADITGNIYIAYVEHTAGENADVFLQKFDASLKPQGGKVRVNPAPGSAKAWHGDAPTIALGKNNAIYVGWNLKSADTTGKGNDLVLSVSRDAGASFAEPVKVNDDTEAVSHGMHSMTLDQSGRVYMAWLDERNVKKVEPAHGKHTMSMMTGAHKMHEEVEPNSEVYFAASGDGGKSFSANKKVASEVCPCCKTSLAAAADGSVYMSWRQVLKGDHRHIAVARLADAGATLGESVVVSDDKWQIVACPVSGAALAATADGVDVMWYTAGAEGQAGVYFARSRDGGRTFSPRMFINGDAVAGTPVLLRRDDNRSFTVFPGKDDLMSGDWSVDKAGFNGRSLSTGTAPAAVLAGGKPVIAYVRPDGDKKSVWLRRAD